MQPDKARPDRGNNAPPRREEFKVARSTSEPGTKLQRRLLQQPMESSAPDSTAAHGEDSSFDTHASPPSHDRAG